MAPKKIGIITQARSTSTRLPRKVLIKLGTKTVLQHHLSRLEWSLIPVYVATTSNSTDDEIAALCEQLKIPCYRGNEEDVLSRYYECAIKFQLDVIVRVTSDCPLIDGHLIKEGVAIFLDSRNGTYLSNCVDRTYPRGFDFEVFSFTDLENAFKNAIEKTEREHVTPFIRNPLKNKSLFNESFARAKDASKFRITLDEEDDLKLLKILIEDYNLEEKASEEIISFLESHPEIAKINSSVEQKKN